MLEQPPRLKNKVPMPKIKQSPCKFCDFKNNDNRGFLNKETADYSRLTLVMIGGGRGETAVLRVRSLTKDLPLVESQDAVAISYCPICGRKI